MPVHILIHAAHLLEGLLRSAIEQGGGWAWAGLIAGGVLGAGLLEGIALPTPEGVALWLMFVVVYALIGAYLGVLAKQAYEGLVHPPSSSDD